MIRQCEAINKLGDRCLNRYRTVARTGPYYCADAHADLRPPRQIHGPRTRIDILLPVLQVEWLQDAARSRGCSMTEALIQTIRAAMETNTDDDAKAAARAAA